MSFREYTIKYKSVSLPSVPGENNIDLLLGYDDEKWTICRTLGSIYEEESSVSEVDDSEVEQLFKGLSNINLPVLQEGIWGLDGTTHTLEITHAMNSTTFKWWVELPEELKPLHKIIVKLFEFAGIDPTIYEELSE